MTNVQQLFDDEARKLANLRIYLRQAQADPAIRKLLKDVYGLNVVVPAVIK